MLQEGIFHAPGTTPPANFGVLFLRIKEDATAPQVGTVLAELWQIYQGLKQGQIPGLTAIPMPTDNLNVSIGYGMRAFSPSGAQKCRPQALGDEFQFRPAAPRGGNPLLNGSGLSYEKDLTGNPAAEHIVIQFLGDTPLSVNRPMVETWKALQTKVDPSVGTPILQITAFYSGFHREDRRSWIDFHDGTSNPRKGAQRLEVVTIKQSNTSAEDAWTRGGSYMTYMRLPIRMDVWNSLPLRDQELLVGRDKVTGCAINRLENDEPMPIAGCPVNSTGQVTDRGNEAFREPPDGVPDVIGKSHVQRSNQHRQDFANPESLRIYRQGYEFAETTVNGVPRVGLNFVAFHDTPFRIRELLTRPTWLGGVNFGGEESDSPVIIDVAAAGIYLLPPIEENEIFPGSTIFFAANDGNESLPLTAGDGADASE